MENLPTICTNSRDNFYVLRAVSHNNNEWFDLISVNGSIGDTRLFIEIEITTYFGTYAPTVNIFLVNTSWYSDGSGLQIHNMIPKPYNLYINKIGIYNKNNKICLCINVRSFEDSENPNIFIRVRDMQTKKYFLINEFTKVDSKYISNIIYRDVLN